MFEVSLCTMIKGENSYLSEWIGYHRSLGVDHFIVYDNESPIPLSETLAQEVKCGLVTVVPIHGRFQQYNALNDGLKRFGASTRWLGFIDLDEFIFPKRAGSLPEFLSAYEGHGGVGINWQMFGSSGHLVRPPGLQIESFLMRAETTYEHNRHIKSIVRPEAVLRVAGAHNCVYRSRYECVNEKRLPIPWGSCDVSVETIQINHYYTRSRAEYLEKLARGRIDKDVPMRFTFDEIDVHLNKVLDEEIKPFAAARTKEYMEAGL